MRLETRGIPGVIRALIQGNFGSLRLVHRVHIKAGQSCDIRIHEGGIEFAHEQASIAHNRLLDS